MPALLAGSLAAPRAVVLKVAMAALDDGAASDSGGGAATVGVGPMRLFVKASSGAVTELNVSGDTTIAEAKALLAPALAVPAERLRLIFAGPELRNDDRSFSDYNLTQDATLHFVVAPENEVIVGEGPLRVFVKTLNGQAIQLRTSYDATPGEAKVLLEPALATPPETMRLIAAGKILDDDLSFAEQNIPGDHTIHCLLP